MASFNKVLLMGNLTRDPELRRTGSGSGVCQLGLAVNRQYMGGDGQMKDETCFVDITVWGKQAESCNQYLRKGSQVFVEGRLRFEQWQDKTSGQNRSKLTVSAERVQFLNSRNDSQGGGQFSQNNQAPSYGQAPAQDNGFAQQQQAPAYAQPAAPAQSSFQAPPAPAPAAPQFQPPPMPDFSNNSDVEDDIPF